MKNRQPPGPKGHWLLGNVLDFLDDPLGHQRRIAAEYGDIVRLRTFIWQAYFINHPDYVKYVLQDNARNFSKQMGEYKRLGWVLGDGLLTSDGDHWLRQRRLMQPAFHRSRIEGYGRLMTQATVEMLDDWTTATAPLDIAAEMMRLTLRIVSEALFDLDISGQANLIGDSFHIVNEYLSQVAENPLSPPRWFPNQRNRQFNQAVRSLKQAVDEIIAARRQRPGDSGDLLAMLMAARDEETGEGMSDQQLRDEVMTLMLAGHETTANALSWTFYLLSEHEAVWQKLQAELDQTLRDPATGRPRLPTVADLAQLPYTRQIIEEALRLYPPAWSIARMTVADDQIGEYPIKAGTAVYISPYAIHRHPAFWNNPDTFDPDRFTPERAAGRPRYAYIPFIGGPRQCIGNNFAMIEAQLILAAVSQRYRLKMVPGHPVVPQPLITLRPQYGLKMTLAPINSAETDYLRQSPANAAHLAESIMQLRDGRVVVSNLGEE